jgi:hypothetical protein
MSGATRIRLTQARLSAVLVVALMVASALACKSYDFIEIVNRTDEAIMISFRTNPDDRRVIEPGESVTLGTPVGTGMTFTVYDNGNALITELGFSQQELEAMDSIITVRDADLRVSE